MKIIKRVFFILAAFIITAVFAMPVIAEIGDFSAKPIFEYKVESGRDPFSPRQLIKYVRGQSNVQISSLMLEGITITGNRKSALLRTTGGFMFSYIFEEGKLYADNSKVIEGITGKILNQYEVLLQQGDREILFKLEKDMTGYNIGPEEE
ncbi:MAG: hypothetical protein CVV21_03090 [Candidatus Goldiibacteriota bacterium HGW-Goldbacteria-1]|jgi:hypothetical protein|nr:MAG: hypothetical protein CVV21_03090 [Candidatus Goldiibacteriota bacterium HGW-Goldbacteria-1]